MAFNQDLTDQIRGHLKGEFIVERKMFGGLCFMLNGKMLCGVEKNKLVVRIGSDQYDWVLKQAHVRPMDFTGRPLRGFIYVLPQGYKSIVELEKWLKLGKKFVSTLPAKKF